MLLIQLQKNLKRTSMYDGSFDDFIDGASCSSIVLPAIAKVNGSQVTLLTGLPTSYFYFRSI
jgi:hypothetical protein